MTLAGCRVLHINATSYGGGVAELLSSEIGLSGHEFGITYKASETLGWSSAASDRPPASATLLTLAAP